MKKILAMVLVLLLALSTAAFAEGGFAVTFSDLVLDIGETYALNPSLILKLGADETTAWIEVEVAAGSESMLAAQIEIGNDTLSASLDGANDAFVVNGMDAMLAEEGVDMTTAEIIALFNSEAMTAFDGATLDATIEAAAAGIEGMTIEKLGDMQYSFTYDDADTGMGISMVATIETAAERDFDLSAKNAVVLDPDTVDDGAMPECDVINVGTVKLATLMTEESVAALVAAVSSLTGAASDAA